MGSGHVESGNDGGGSKSELGSTLLSGSWGVTAEGILSIVLNGGGTGSISTGSGGISLSWAEISATGTILNTGIGGIIIGTSNLGGDGGNKSDGEEFHFCFKFIFPM